MTYKVLSGGFPSGYTLSSGSAYTGVSVTATGSVGGSGLLVQKAGAVVINSGQLLASGSGNGVYLTAGGLIRNRYGGLIEGLNGVFATHGGSVVNYGTIIGGGAGAAVDAAGGATTVVNGGTIACADGTVGVSVSFANAADRLIVTNSASFVGEIEGGGGTLELDAQYGTVSGLGATAVFGGAYASGQFADFSTYEFSGGVWILNGVNSLAAGQTLSVQTGGGDYVRNLGSLAAATGAEVQVSSGYFFNGSKLDTTAQITTASGVYVQGILANYGVIDGSGGYSVRGVDSSETLIVEAGAKFIGKATADGGTIVFNQGGGTITGLGGAAALSGSVALSFGGFGTYEFDAGAWTLDGPGALAANDELVDFGNLGIFGTITNAGAIVATAGGTIDLHGAILGAAGAAGIDATVGGVFNIDDGSVANVQGKLTNTGTIALISTTDATDLRILSGGASLSGGGTLTLSGAKARILGATAGSTLTNIDNTIIGVGSVGVNDMTLVNQAAGVIAATGLLTVRDAAGHSLTNSGLMEATGAGKLALVSETINQGGGGTILAADGLVTLQGVDFIGGTLTTTGAGRINVDGGGATLDGSTNAVSNAGLLQVTGGQTLTVDGNVANGGKLDLHAARLLIGAAGATLSGAGQVNLSANATNVIVGAAAGTTLTNVDNRIAGSGNLGDGLMTLVNQSGGQIIGNQGVALTIDTGTNTIVNAGLIENNGKGGTLIKSAIANSGTLLAVTAGTLTLQGAVTGSGVAQINGGTLYVQQAFAENVAFTGSTGVLKLGDSQAYSGQITGLSKIGTNSLDLADIAFSNSKTKASYSGTTASGTLTVTDGTHTAKITLVGNYLGSTFMVSTDGHGGTSVVDPHPPAAPALVQAMAGILVRPAAVAVASTTRPSQYGFLSHPRL